MSINDNVKRQMVEGLSAPAVYLIHYCIIPTQCFYRFFGDFDWSVGKIKLFLHFDKSPCVGIFDNCLDMTVVDCVNNNELYIKL